MVTLGDPALKERIDSERNQGRAPDMDWLDHDRLGFNYRLERAACALGLAQLDRLDGMLAARARVAAAYGEALAGIEGLELPCPDERRRMRGWFVYVVGLPRGRRSRRDDPRAARARRPEQALPAGDPPDELLPRDASATARASFRSARTSRRARSRCRSSRRSTRDGSSGSRRPSRPCSAAAPSWPAEAQPVDWRSRHVALLRAPAPRLPGDQRLARLRPAPVAL